ncbi:scaffolding protein [Phyllobacterium brassicacearum]|uniref:Scaffolding protein n=1 Tax=Phyllobacterium brassicacearum TaxID=314235 RepID=A0A2P7BWI0_9HYPH|nr:MipA/OmpV family protein [Phyllobacterium brassicacearum]PSH70818.1 scaffolding protein [Phyllobacterium brassicacearum]TDQ35693.1 outer membrane scaffolding protein for murein synthesis (MipA/OmpV family) [Phyllobacterium brassicacearum]
MSIRLIGALSSALFFAGSTAVLADEYYPDNQPTSSTRGDHWWSGDWYLTLGAKGFVAPRYEGATEYLLRAAPVISLGRAGRSVRFSSLNDNASIGFVDTGVFRAGLTGKLITGRDDGDSDDLKGLNDVDWGFELGGFAEFYPTDNIRGRVEVRRGIGAHDGVVADVSVDAFKDLTETVRVSAGPRATFATEEYFQEYYGVNATESAASGLKQYSPGGGLKSLGIGGQITWQTTDKVTTSAYAEYNRLMGPAADSSLVKERGSANQATFGLQATYRFDFSL